MTWRFSRDGASTVAPFGFNGRELFGEPEEFLLPIQNSPAKGTLLHWTKKGVSTLSVGETMSKPPFFFLVGPRRFNEED